MKLHHHTTDTTSPCPLPSRDAKVKHGVHCFEQEKHRRSSRTGPVWLKNFGANYCGDLSVMTWCLVNNRFHPAQVQKALCGAKKNPRMARLLQRGREQIVDIMLSSPADEALTDAPVEHQSDNLPDLASWVQETLGGGRLDLRGVRLLSSMYATARRSFSRWWTATSTN